MCGWRALKWASATTEESRVMTSNSSRLRSAVGVGWVLVSACRVSAGSPDTEDRGSAGTMTGTAGAAGNGASGGNTGGNGSSGGASGVNGGAAGADGSAGTNGAAGTSGTAGSSGTPPPSGHELTAAACSSGAETFIDAIDAGAFHDIELTPEGGMAALLAEMERLRSEELDTPVRLRLAPGDYAPTDVGSGEIYVKGLERPAQAPLLIQAVDGTPNATRLGQGFNLVAVSYLAFDGLTIGPATVGAYGSVGQCEEAGSCYHDAPKPLAAQAGIHVSGTAVDPSASGLRDGHLDFAIYGRYRPAHHVVVRNVTVQNIFGDDEPSGVGAAGGGSDGIKFNQAADVWVIASRVRQTSRHSVDNVGVHGGCFQGNVLASSGQGLGIEAKGGSVDVTFEGNVIVDVRRVEIGGENTDATYYWSAEEPGSTEHYAYEGRRIVARNNVIIDAREGALEFSGCHECAAVQNTVVFRAGFDLGSGGGDAVREVDSHVNREGAGTDCTPLDGETLESCWGVGAYPADLVPVPGEPGESRVLANAGNTLAGNLFMTEDALWGPALNPYNHPNSSHAFGFTRVDVNYWYNGGAALEDPGDGSFLVEGPGSVYTGSTPNAAPGLAGTLGALDAANAGLAAEVTAALRPVGGSPLIGQADVSVAWFAAVDRTGTRRPAPPSIGALEPAP